MWFGEKISLASSVDLDLFVDEQELKEDVQSLLYKTSAGLEPHDYKCVF